MHYTYHTKNVCSSQIDFDLNDGIVTNIKFVGGCPGNLRAIGKLLEGQKADEIIAKLKGNMCGYKKTSCADQLALALEEANHPRK
ncbi:MAG: TIGR03905 family TSCPD domain-containing protein [Bacilli bacterium]|nr:TIGR03905 family TSCPD domain-containing protein [Bacilli bacterium]MCQ2794267.1 TIGR03905 family TSCPD domain-containing protein [Bacilli bacterium]